jgi:hypothetical protein
MHTVTYMYIFECRLNQGGGEMAVDNYSNTESLCSVVIKQIHGMCTKHVPINNIHPQMNHSQES